MNTQGGTEAQQLLAKICDMAERSERTGTPLFTKFLREEECALVQKHLATSIYRDALVTWGGFADGERRVAGFFPDYLADFARQTPWEYFPITALKIDGSGYRTLSHRDFLGAMLSLGISRESVGDIYVENDQTAYCVLLESVSGLVITELDRVGSDKVKCTQIPLTSLPKAERRFEEMHETVASTRLDGVVSAVLSVSRDKSEKLICAGAVSVDHVQQCDKSYVLKQGELLSVKGYGRFLLYETGGLSKKGRTRIIVRRFI